MMKSLLFSAHHTPPLLPAPRLRRLLRLCAFSASASATPRADRLVPLSSAARPCRGLAAVSLSRGAAGRRLPGVSAMSSSTPPPGPVQKSEEEWQAILTPEQFNILRLKGTERRKLSLVRARTDGSGSGSAAAEASTVGDNLEGEESGGGELVASAGSSAGKQPPPVNPKIEKELKKAVQKTVATFAPRASMKTKNPAVSGSALYTVFEVQGYVSMLLGGALSFNLVFPSNEPDIWRLMGMWSIWMFTIPSLRARDCSNKEKEALNYLFLLIPLINVIIPFFVKSFAVVWSADTVAFFVMYAWKLGWLQSSE